MTPAEREELEQLRRYAATAIMNPLERSFFQLHQLLDSLPSSSALAVIGRAVCELRREIGR